MLDKIIEAVVAKPLLVPVEEGEDVGDEYGFARECVGRRAQVAEHPVALLDERLEHREGEVPVRDVHVATLRPHADPDQGSGRYATLGGPGSGGGGVGGVVNALRFPADVDFLEAFDWLHHLLL